MLSARANACVHSAIIKLNKKMNTLHKRLLYQCVWINQALILLNNYKNNIKPVDIGTE